MSNCKDRNWKVEQIFKAMDGDNGSSYADAGDILVLKKDDGSMCPYFLMISGRKEGEECCPNLTSLKRIYPPEEESKDVDVVCEGKTTTLTREDARKLNLI